MRAVIIPRIEGGSIVPRNESCVNCDGPISMVAYLHQQNVYTKRKLMVWRDQKCNPLGGAITPLTCGAVKIPHLVGGSTVPRTESWVNWDAPMTLELCLHQGNIYTKWKLRLWRDQKCVPLVGAISPVTCGVR